MISKNGNKKKPIVIEVVSGFLAAIALFGFYFGIHSLTDSLIHAVEQLVELWPWIMLLIISFGIEFGLFTYIIREIKRRRTAAAMVTTSGVVSAGSMIACCAPRLVDTAPLLGLSPVAVFLADYMLFFLIMGVIFNVLGIIIILRTIQRYGLYDNTRGILKSLFRFDMGHVLKASSGIGFVALVSILVPMLTGNSSTHAVYRLTEELHPNERQGIVTFTVSFQIPESTGKFQLWLPYVTSNEYQLIENVKIDGNFDNSGIYREPEHGNIILFTEWHGTEEYVRLSYSFEVTRREILMKNFPENESSIPIDLMERYLRPVSLEPVDTEVKIFAEEITRGESTILGKALAIYNYIVDNGERDPDISGCGIGDLDALLNNISGKCVDISTLFVALARSVDVPAREVFGTRIAKEGDISGAYHCRAEFYLPGYGWVPVDPSDVLKLRLVNNLDLEDEETVAARQYLFGAQSETYIDFYSGRDITLLPHQRGSALTYFMYPYAEIDGVPLNFVTPGHPAYQEGLDYNVTYKEIVGSIPRILPW
ncbi:MAG: hypothetical protein JSU58_02635 [Dehalococcoidales bacterium]|nr:MAG: hypothetical protein JSU58_02635 [Dehalococcoidales bacterium]